MELKKSFLFICSAVFLSIFAFGLLSVQTALAGAGDNVSGFAWSENIGWASANNTSGGGSTSYGLNIAADGTISGDAWSENIGWITFNAAGTSAGNDLTGCPTGTCKATVDMSCPSSQCTITGWARVLANGGGWDGWIKLAGNAQDGSPYGIYIDPTTKEFRGWAWSDMVVGWISFNCLDRGICATSNYKWMTTATFTHPPVAAMSCDASSCSGGTCNPTTWVSFRPTADPVPCNYAIHNDSTDPNNDINGTDWYYKIQGSPDTSYQPVPGCAHYAGISNCTMQSGIAAGTYTIKLTVTDGAGSSSSATHDITIKAEVVADFMCSLDNINWKDCSTPNLKVVKDALYYFKDDPSLTRHSVASEGAGGINARAWVINGVAFGSGGNATNPSVTITQKTNIVSLTVTDSNGRSDSQQYTLKAKSLPDWEEVSSSDILINRFLAGIYRFWSK